MRDPDLLHLPAVSLVAPGGGHRTSPAVRPEVDKAEQAIVERERIAFERGLLAGRETAEASITVEVARALDALTSAARDIETARNAWAATGPELATSLAIELVEMILLREITTATDPGRDAIMRCFDQLTPTDSVTVRLNPADVETLGATSDLVAGREIKILADASIDPGGAIADFPGGTVDASLTSALDRIREVLAS